MKKNKAKKVLRKSPLKKSPKKKSRLKKMATKISQTTKKMVDEVMLKLIGTRVLERAQNVSASLKKDKARGKKVQED